MKLKKIIIFLFLGTCFVGAQNSETNAFQQSENRATGVQSNSNSLDREGIANKPEDLGNPPGEDEIPIDEYLPLLFVIGAGVSIYKIKSKKVTV